MPKFDPDAAAQPDSGVFGLPHTRKESRIILVQVPFDATTSYRPGTIAGPTTILDASMQVDLFDRTFGRVYEQGIHMLDEVDRIAKISEEAAEAAAEIIEAGGAQPEHAPLVKKVDAACEQVRTYVRAEVAKILAEGKIPGTIGGEHSVPLGAIEAIAAAHPGVGILHIDAHMDFREAFEGFAFSHASIMHNVISRVPGVAKLVQVGIRDFGERELAFANAHKDRVHVHFDEDWARRQMDGERFRDLAASAIAQLPDKVYVSFDIDALDPSLCPNTGTPVPGGFSFHQAVVILETLKASGKKVVGFDLVEVAPDAHHGDGIDGIVGARILYKLCGVC
jgi:agmatinase